MTEFKCKICGRVGDLDMAINSPEFGLICAPCDLLRTKVPPSENTCVCCGEVIPEGRQVCAVCETKNTGDAIARGIIDGINSPCPYTVPPLNIGKKKDNPVDIHKIIDDAMEKRDRTVSIYIGESGVSVNVYPVDHDKCQWIYVKVPDGNGGFIGSLKCSNCGYVLADIRDKGSYCSGCGELVHGVKEAVVDEET